MILIRGLKQSTLVIAGVAVLIILANSIIALSASPSFCRLCHPKELMGLEKSAHIGITCGACHAKPGLLGLSTERLSILGMTGRHLTGSYPKPVTAQTSSATCRLCHGDVEGKTSERNGIRVSHKELVREGYSCTECHNTTAHGEATPQPKRITMEKCTHCHDGSKQTGKAEATCELCHTTSRERDRKQASVWNITHGKNWRKTHGMGNTQTCQLCHAVNYCRQCHEVDMPHPDAWINMHGKEALTVAKSCSQCHARSLCDSCHGLPMPHPESFINKHSTLVKEKGDKACLNCHTENGCELCHSRHKHPGISEDRLRELQRNLEQ